MKTEEIKKENINVIYTASYKKMCVIATAGAGKTYLIASRIQHLITKEKVDPCRILAVTFTNKARDEMYDRTKSLLSSAGISSCGVDIMTLDSLAKRITEEKLCHPIEVFEKPFVAMTKYQYTFDMIKEAALDALADKKFRDVLSKRYDHILIDEFQDTTDTLFTIIHSLLTENNSLLVVGDDDQNILFEGSDLLLRPFRLVPVPDIQLIFQHVGIRIAVERLHRSVHIIF